MLASRLLAELAADDEFDRVIAASDKLARLARAALAEEAAHLGLKLRYNLFRTADAAPVYGAYASFYEERRRPLQRTGHEWQRIDFHSECNGWVVVNLDGGWEWTERREVPLVVSRRLACPGFLVFVYDGDYWGYEFLHNGVALDHFVQEATGDPVGFPGEDCRGQPEVLASFLPFLRVEDIGRYLVQKHNLVKPADMNVPARPGDQFRRFDECAVLDFLPMLGVRVELQDGYVRVQSPVFRSAFKRSSPQASR